MSAVPVGLFVLATFEALGVVLIRFETRGTCRLSRTFAPPSEFESGLGLRKTCQNTESDLRFPTGGAPNHSVIFQWAAVITLTLRPIHEHRRSSCGLWLLHSKSYAP